MKFIKNVFIMIKNSVADDNLELGDYNCMAVVTSHTFNSDGVMFEFTQSRHRPDCFSFQDNAIRRQG